MLCPSKIAMLILVVITFCACDLLVSAKFMCVCDQIHESNCTMAGVCEGEKCFVRKVLRQHFNHSISVEDPVWEEVIQEHGCVNDCPNWEFPVCENCSFLASTSQAEDDEYGHQFVYTKHQEACFCEGNMCNELDMEELQILSN